MASRLDPFVDVLLREGADQLYLLPDEPVTIVKDGKPRKVSKQPLTDRHIYALLMEVAPSEAADRIDKKEEAEFDYAADKGLVRVRVLPESGRLTAVVLPAKRVSGATTTAARPAAPAARPPRPSAIAAAPLVAEPVATPPPERPAAAPTALPGEFAASQYQAAEQRLRELLAALVTSGSSDLHLRAGTPPIFRTRGALARQPGAVVAGGDLELMLLAVMPERNRAQWKEHGDADFAYALPGVARFRVNAGRDRGGATAVFRVIPAKVVTVDELEIAKDVQQLCQLPKGLILVTGAAGSGKSTTLCALIDLVNRSRAAHIVTIEDPIEFVHESKEALVTQRQVHVHTESFPAGLRAALREDPDVVLVSELRDLETITLTLELAETGRLVFATLPTPTAAATVERLLDRFPPERQAQIRVLLAETLKGVIAQTLCRKPDGGRVAAREVLLVTPAVANLIREGKTFQIPSVMQTGKKLGMVTLQDALLDLVEKKQIDADEAYARAVERATMAGMLKAKGFKLSHAEA